MIYVARKLLATRRRRRFRRLPKLLRRLVKPNPVELWLRSLRERRQ